MKSWQVCSKCSVHKRIKNGREKSGMIVFYEWNAKDGYVFDKLHFPVLYECRNCPYEFEHLMSEETKCQG